ncbi:MAG: hypothetical protein GTO17_02740 [Candidatus Aminicenantes bacterium]|nr:hypothetical protein [Candidatus Aminicenantes bacterium]
MPRENYEKYFKILEISPDASLFEIKHAYLRLKKLYSTESPVIAPIAEEFPKKRRREILKEIEEAYSKIIALLENEQESVYDDKPSVSSEIAEKGKEERISFSGPVLRQIRERLGIQLHEVALDTKIRVEHLENIEDERYEALPPEPYLKGHLKTFAGFLLLNPTKVASDYLKKYREWREELSNE